MFHEPATVHFDRKPAKCARITGDVTGKYHPHGMEAVYDTMVRMAQDFVMRVPLIDGQGNFGSVDGDAAAHYRYTEARLTAIADHLLAELRQHTVPMQPTYNGEFQEPTVLPAQFPNLLVNGGAGIAVGMATNIPPHNLGEVVRACIHLIENPDATTAQLLDRIKGPDFPLGGRIITDRATLRQIYEEGHGSIKVQAEWALEEKGSKRQIVIQSIPYGVNKGELENHIGSIIADRKLPQATDLTNETNEKEGMRITIDIKKDADPSLVMAYLYKHTQLQDNFAVNLTCLAPDAEGILQPQRLGLKEILRHFVDFPPAHQCASVSSTNSRSRAGSRIHILEGFEDHLRFCSTRPSASSARARGARTPPKS